MIAPFKDNFSKQAGTYVKYRPTYPAGLFEFLSTLTKGHNLAWDCGTGNGQSAVSLANYYQQVYATDPSGQQIKNALLHPQITYKVEKAEHCALADNTVDIITVAQALHWFDFDTFYATAKRVLKQDGIIAVWCYGLPNISTEIDAIVKHFHDDVIGEFWQAENRLIEKEYKTIPFPFEEIEHPAFQMQKVFSLHELFGLFESWSATQRYIDAHGNNPVKEVEQQLQKLWGNRDDKKTFTWNIILKLGKNISG